MIDDAVSTHSRLKAAGTPEAVLVKATSGFNTQPPKGGWVMGRSSRGLAEVSTHSRLKAAGYSPKEYREMRLVSTHSRLKAAGVCQFRRGRDIVVSTHSRLKAAGGKTSKRQNQAGGFNTQPPKGGWVPRRGNRAELLWRFNTQPPKGGWLGLDESPSCLFVVSTHSRLKAAGQSGSPSPLPKGVSTHSRLKAAGQR